jgi:hypothetical protein
MTQFTPEIDRQIVAGFWGDQKAMLLLLAEGGFSREAVFQRAEKIGVIKGRSSHSAGIEIALLLRQCLRCDQVFLAQGLFNRLCRRCLARN